MIFPRLLYKYLLTLLMVAFFGTAGKSQRSSFILRVNNANQTFNTTTTVENGISNPSAFELDIESYGFEYNLTAWISAKNFNPSTTTFPSTPFTISLRSITGVATTGQVNGNIEVPDAPLFAVLAQNATRTASTPSVWTYDINFKPLGYDIPPGTYTFTMMVRYTDIINIVDRSFTVTLTVQPTLALEVIQNNVATYNFNSVRTLIDGIEMRDINTLKVRSNVRWVCNLASATDFFTFNGINNSDMPSTVMQIRRSWETALLLLRRTSSSLKTGIPGNASRSGNTFNISLRSDPTFDYPPGQYVINAIFTISQQ